MQCVQPHTALCMAYNISHFWAEGLPCEMLDIMAGLLRVEARRVPQRPTALWWASSCRCRCPCRRAPQRPTGPPRGPPPAWLELDADAAKSGLLFTAAGAGRCGGDGLGAVFRLCAGADGRGRQAMRSPRRANAYNHRSAFASIKSHVCKHERKHNNQRIVKDRMN
eukprot:scaffold281001_cov51-Prasinocladus_malaysianus.AAC.1